MRHWTLLAACASIALCSTPAVAQLRATRISPAQLRQALEAGIDPSQLMTPDGPGSADMLQPPNEGPMPDSPEALEQQKQQLLQTLEFDRRPSSILKLWASPA
ncbi:MAG: hypothetical protein RLZZ436_2474, partial [Planctomycetota bacterium]